jgi:hypothetical protein
MPAPAGRTINDAVVALLDSATSLTVFEGDAINPAGPPVNADGYVSPHAVVWGGAGQVTLENLAASPDGRTVEFQVTVVGANSDACLIAADKTVGALVGARLTIPDGTSGVIRQTADAGPARVDTERNPHTTYLPLLFGCRFTPLV